MNGTRPTPNLPPGDQAGAAVQDLARAFEYPPAPDLVAGVRAQLRAGRPVRAAYRPRLAWALAAVVLALAALLAVPQVRAAIADILQIGGIRVYLVAPTATPVPLTPTSAPAGGISRPVTATPTPQPSPTPLASVLDLAGETTLDRARAEANFDIGLPAYPADLGEPDRVFVQQFGGPLVVLAWTAAGQPDRVILSLHEFGPGTYADKFQPKVVQETTVGGGRALWTEGAHLLVLQSGEMETRELVRAHTLIWQRDGVTYRLETGAGLDEAVRIAESVR